MSKLLDVLKSCQKYGYFDLDTNKNIIKYTNLGTLFTQNIKRQWMDSETDVKVYPNRNVYNCETSSPGLTNDIPKLLFDCQKFHDNFLRVQKDFQRTIPFAISQEVLFRDNVMSLLQSDDTPPSPATIDRIPTHFLSHLYFIHPSAETEVFSRVQRTKKIWWMKYTLNPGRIFLSDRVQNIYDTVYIKARYDFGDLILEKIQTIPFESVVNKQKYDYSLMCTATSKQVCPQIIRSETCLEIATIGLLCDAVDAESSEKLYVHRKLAPYQCAVLIDLETAPRKNDLLDYAKFLMLNLKTERVSVGNLIEKSPTINFIHETRKAIDGECRKLDIIGVPYVLIVNEDTLAHGALKLRQRDTGLSQVIHVSDIPNEIVRNLS